MQNISKRGLVGIVSIVVFIAASIASLAIVWTSISATANQLSPALSCSEMQASLPLRIDKACIDNGQIKVTLSRNSETEIKEAKISLAGDNSLPSQQFSCGNNCESCIIPKFSGDSTIFTAHLSNEEITSASLFLDGCFVSSVDITSCN